MTDLTDDFFKRDLTDTEEDRLAQELESSPEAAGRLLDLADKEYALTGLPDPRWPNAPASSIRPFPPSPPKPIPALLKPLAVAAAVAVTAAGAFLAMRHKAPGPAAVASFPAPAASPSPAVAAPIVKSPVLVPPPAPKPAVSAPTQVLSPTPVPPPPTAVPEKVVSQSAPGAQGRTYEQLSVVLDLEERAIATVRVSTPEGAVVRTMFAGLLDKGEWRFTWDGKTDTGATAPNGTYHVVVASGGRTVEREVRLEKVQ